MRSLLWRRLLLPLGDALANQTVMAHLSHYEESQRWPHARIREEQDRLVRKVVETAYRDCRFYRELYDDAGVHPGDIRGAEDLPRLPMVDKAMLRAAYPEHVTRKTRFRTREYSTSGSTGRPFTVLIDDDTMSRARALMLLRTMYAGWDLGLPLFQTGMAIERGRLKAAKDLLLRVTYRSAFDLSDDRLDRYLDVIARRRIAFVAGYAQSIYLLAQRAAAVGFDHELRAAITWGSNLLPQFRDAIREAFGCPTLDSYGVGEGMQIASQSLVSGDYLHQFALHVAAEIVDAGEPVPAGRRGEVILTRLDAGAMPLIRYRIGDVGRAAERPVPTGDINLPLWRSVDGRVSDIIRTPRGNQLIVEFFFGIMQYAPTIKLFQVEQTAPDTLHFRIVTAPGYEPAHWDRVATEILDKGDPDLKLEVEVVDDIPLEKTGKRRFIISRLGQQ